MTFQLPNCRTFTPRSLTRLGFCNLGTIQGLKRMGFSSDGMFQRNGGLSDDYVIEVNDFCYKFIEMGGEDSELYKYRTLYFRSVAKMLGFVDTPERTKLKHFIEYAKVTHKLLSKPQLIMPRRVSELVGR